MKFVNHTVSKPVAGKEAQKLSKALESNNHVANATAMNTIERIAKRRKQYA
jgi:hypothetical protein